MKEDEAVDDPESGDLLSKAINSTISTSSPRGLVDVAEGLQNIQSEKEDGTIRKHVVKTRVSEGTSTRYFICNICPR